MNVRASRTDAVNVGAEIGRCRPFAPCPEGVLEHTIKEVNSTTRIRLLLVLLALASALLVFSLGSTTGEAGPPEVSFSELNMAIDNGQVIGIEFVQGSATITGTLVDGSEFQSTLPPFVGDFAQGLIDEHPGIQVSTVVVDAGTNWFAILATIAPLLVMILLVILILGRMNGGKSARKKFTARTRKKQSELQDVTFADVAGADEAVLELGEIREFLTNPQRFAEIGAKIPKGVLLYGPPGTGKTLLARAVAGEAGVPFFTLSGSDFVEMYAGVGASRVRDLFEEARKQAPAIIFVDEIDAIGRHRGGSAVAGNEEREQTLNQLLVEMDGFDVETGVIFIAATNRPDVLDQALLRPGRFDRQVAVERPDLHGRRQIISVHAKGKPFGPDADPETIARRTPGFTGADIANLLNEAALLAARREIAVIGQREVDDALDRVIAGPEKATTTLSEKEKQIIAYHEAGHALVGHVLPNADPIHKVSIIARGKALGWTLALPEKDKVLRSQSELHDEMAMLLGGRIAEELIFGEPTTGAANDIERVTAIARSMVTEFAMSADLGLQKFGLGIGESYNSSTKQNYSDGMAQRIDDEIRTIVDTAADEARELLTLHRNVLDHLASELIEHETLDREALEVVFRNLKTVSPDASEAAEKRLDLRHIDLG